MTILIMTCSKTGKWLWLVQSQQNENFNYDLLKGSKMASTPRFKISSPK